jgi:hypothetical protein
VPPEEWQSSGLLQKAHVSILPGHVSLAFGMNLHLDDAISMLK